MRQLIYPAIVGWRRLARWLYGAPQCPAEEEAIPYERLAAQCDALHRELIAERNRRIWQLAPRLIIKPLAERVLIKVEVNVLVSSGESVVANFVGARRDVSELLGKLDLRSAEITPEIAACMEHSDAIYKEDGKL